MNNAALVLGFGEYFTCCFQHTGTFVTYNKPHAA